MYISIGLKNNTSGQNFPTNIFFPNYIYLVDTLVCLSEENLPEQVISFSHVGSRDSTHMVRCPLSKYLNLLNHRWGSPCLSFVCLSFILKYRKALLVYHCAVNSSTASPFAFVQQSEVGDGGGVGLEFPPFSNPFKSQVQSHLILLLNEFQGREARSLGLHVKHLLIKPPLWPEDYLSQLYHLLLYLSLMAVLHRKELRVQKVRNKVNYPKRRLRKVTFDPNNDLEYDFMNDFTSAEVYFKSSKFCKGLWCYATIK